MKYSEFERIMGKTGINTKFWPVLWRAFRFEKPDYMPEALGEFLAKVKRISTVNDILRNETVSFGAILMKYRILRPVTGELVRTGHLNMRKVLENCDYNHDRDFDVLRFPMVFPRCSCGRRVRVQETDGVWRCVCGMVMIDEFFFADKIRATWDFNAKQPIEFDPRKHGAREGGTVSVGEFYSARAEVDVPQEGAETIDGGEVELPF